MSTNYYLTLPASHPLSVLKPLHIGQFSGGWAFSFRGYRLKASELPRTVQVELAPGINFEVAAPAVELWVTSWSEWKELLSIEGAQVHDEYGAPEGVHEFIRFIEDAAHPERVGSTGHRC